MMDFHVLTPAGPELLMRVVDGQLIIVPALGAEPQKVVPQNEESKISS